MGIGGGVGMDGVVGCLHFWELGWVRSMGGLVGVHTLAEKEERIDYLGRKPIYEFFFPGMSLFISWIRRISTPNPCL